jgi:hypothetical protein
MLAWLAPLKKHAASEPATNVDSVRNIAHLVDVAARHGVTSTNCLDRSLVLWWLLWRQGLASEIRFGARNGDGGFQAHAWVEHNGQVVGDREDIRRDFAPFESTKLDHSFQADMAK